MILRRVVLERYGCFGSAEFEFRRGMNLISGANEAGKSLLLSALSAGLLGVEHGSRLRSWGDSLSCRVTLLFDKAAGSMRLTRDLESNLVRIEERGDEGPWRETFAGILPPADDNSDKTIFSDIPDQPRLVGNRGFLRLLFDDEGALSLFSGDGRQAAEFIVGITAVIANPDAVAMGDKEGQRQEEISVLEAELAADRADHEKGKQYLEWIRKRWETGGDRGLGAQAKPAAGASTRELSTLERRRDELRAELECLGLPIHLPPDLPALFDKAEGLRQELAALQLELTPLQRRRQGVRMPGYVWPLLLTLVALGVSGGAYWLKMPWFLAVAAGCGTTVLLAWLVFLVRFHRLRTVRDGLDQELLALESKREDALSRQAGLAERFEAYGLPSVPVEMVKLQQLCRRNDHLIGEYCNLCAQLGTDNAAAAGSSNDPAGDRHLRPEDLPEAESRLAALGESLRRREARLADLRSGSDVGGTTSVCPRTDSPQVEACRLLESIRQHLERLTGGRLYGMRLQDGRLQLEAAPGKWTVPSSCSQGTVECLALGTRMALSQMIGGLLPLTVDDLPAHLDTKRRQAVMRTLERYAVDHQLLLTSSDDELAKRAVRERWHVVNLKQQVNEPPLAEEEKADAGQLYLL